MKKTNKSTKAPIQRQKCMSIKSSSEPHLRCLLMAKPGENYCSLHLIQKNIKNYTIVDDTMQLEPEPILDTEKQVVNTAIRKIILDDIAPPVNKMISIKKHPVSSKTNSTMREQKVSTVENVHKENEEELEIKLLILVNDDEYCDKISELVGPVFKDVTLSEDEQDPVTLDTIWYMSDGIRTAASVNKYYLFSYIDSKDKIRCLTIFTIYKMIQDGNFTHPITMEAISTSDIDRAKQLIDLYQTKIGLFNGQDDSNLSPEFKLKNRLTRLFKKFHIHSIYLEENWLISITDTSKLFKIINETEKLLSNNWKSINPNTNNPKILQRKAQFKKTYAATKGKGRRSSSKYSNKKNSWDSDDDTNTNDTSDSIINLQEYIVGEWERLIDAADTPQNQMPIWILASGLSFVVPEVKQKFPDLEIMLQ